MGFQSDGDNSHLLKDLVYKEGTHSVQMMAMQVRHDYWVTTYIRTSSKVSRKLF